MAAKLQSARYHQFKQLLHKVATRLGEADVRSLVFNQDLPEELKERLGVDVLQKLEREGLFSDRNIHPLAELLRAIERHDLVNNYVQEYIQKFGSELAEEEEEEEEEKPDGVSLTTPQDNRSIGTITEYPECESQDISSPEVDYPPRLQKHEIHRKGQAGATLTKLNPENSQTVSRHMPAVNPATQAHHPSQRSTGNTRDVGKKQSIKRSRSVSETMSGPGDCHQMFQCQHCLKDLSSSNDSGIELQPGASSIGPRRNSDPLLSQHPETSSNAIGQHETKPPKQQGATKQARKSLSWLSSFRKKGDTELNESVTVSWKVKRSEFVGPLFFHKNKYFEKKVKVSAGSRPTRLNLDVNFKLFPNGINWDQDSYSTLKIEVTSPSQTLSSDVHLQLVVTGADCETGEVITSRQAEWPLREEACIIREFIAHEVIKFSSAKYFEFKATLRVKYSLSKDWVVVDPINSKP